MFKLAKFLLLGVILVWNPYPADAEPAGANYDESKVPPYTLPDPLVMASGKRVESATDWPARRKELLNLFRQHVYGVTPSPGPMSFLLEEHERVATEPPSIRKVVRIKLGGDQGFSFPVTIYLPRAKQTPAPIFVGMHLFDSAQKQPQPGAPLFLPPKPGEAPPERPDDEALRELPGEKTLETILARGYGIATLNARDLAPDDANSYDRGVVSYFRQVAGKPERGAADWGAIGAWAFGLSRALDYFTTDADIDARRAIVIGHSRMGKTALWAAAQDERFAMAISNNSGCGGAALSRRIFGETVAHINDRFPHWFCVNFRNYNGHEAECPVDQHELLALIAPRPTYVASALADVWADPRGEWLSAVAATPVFQLLGGGNAERGGVEGDYPPPLNRRVGGTLGYHLRMGRHALTDFDWLRYLDFADAQLPGSK